jgi:predicted nucleotide-binding protein (sugar kinase/HSP70/actin superfamily)
MRIGIPQALLYYRYGKLWKRFFSMMGEDVVVSPETTDEMLSDGIRHSVGDICLPVKSFFGHVLALKDTVDYLFIPRMIRIEKDSYLCPKFLGLPDMVKAAIRNLPPIIDTEFNIKEKPFITFLQDVWNALKIKKQFLLPHDMNLEESIPEFITFSDKGDTWNITVGIAGRPYLVFDQCLNKGIIRHLRKMGVNTIYHNPEEDYIAETMNMLPKWVYWSMGKEVVSSVRRMLEDDIIDGVILLSNAGCGPDSFIAELAEHALSLKRKPYMNLILDEHTSDAGLQTRIEAFVDMIERHYRERIP